MSKIDLIHGDCLVEMQRIPDKSVDMVLCDLPYGTTACKWDVVIPFDKLWEQYSRIVKGNGAIVLFGSQPFTSLLVASNLPMFKYEWIWKKAVGSNFATTKFMPMKEHENILVFGKGKLKYNPIPQPRSEGGKKRCDYGHSGGQTGKVYNSISFKGFDKSTYDKDFRCPSSVQYFNNRESCRGLHPTQKPVALLEYLIKTYSNEGDTILDNTMGSGSTMVACVNTKRNGIGIELDDNYFKIAQERVKQAQQQLTLF